MLNHPKNDGKKFVSSFLNTKSAKFTRLKVCDSGKRSSLFL